LAAPSLALNITTLALTEAAPHPGCAAECVTHPMTGARFDTGCRPQDRQPCSLHAIQVNSAAESVVVTAMKGSDDDSVLSGAAPFALS
jgi:hypothetical protein